MKKSPSALILTLIITLIFPNYSQAEKCSNPGYLILKYNEFGSSAVAYPLLGNDVWQWQCCTSPKEIFDVKVIVYNKINESKIMDTFPVDESKNIDYRYVTYESSMNYLNTTIMENIYPPGKLNLIKTRRKLQAKFACR